MFFFYMYDFYIDAENIMGVKDYLFFIFFFFTLDLI